MNIKILLYDMFFFFIKKIKKILQKIKKLPEIFHEPM